jgi:hypothetical protein
MQEPDQLKCEHCFARIGVNGKWTCSGGLPLTQCPSWQTVEEDDQRWDDFKKEFWPLDKPATT